VKGQRENTTIPGTDLFPIVGTDPFPLTGKTKTLLRNKYETVHLVLD
jgi:hypothetical protein